MAAYQAAKDAEHIKLLSVFHYVMAGLLAVGTLWPLIYVAMGLVFVSMPVPSTPATPTSPGPAPAVSSSPATGGSPSAPAATSAPAPIGSASSMSSPSSTGAAEAKMMGWMFFGIGVFMALGFLVMALANFLCARYLSARRRRIFIFVVSGLNTMAFPVGTALGVFTFIVLARPSVEGLFEGQVEALGVIR